MYYSVIIEVFHRNLDISAEIIKYINNNNKKLNKI